MSTTKTPKGKTSPVKQRTQKQQQNGESQLDGPEYVVIDKDLMRGLSEKEVEIEHLKTTVVALQEKVVVCIFKFICFMILNPCSLDH